MLISYDDPNYYEIIKQSRQGLELMVNSEFYFYGVFNNMFKIDDMVLDVLEDPQDGYRSSMGAAFHYTSLDDIVHRFQKRPLGKVRLESMDDIRVNPYEDEADGFEYSHHSIDGYRLIDVDTKHVWLYFGTDCTCEYYPYFVFKYKPDKNQKDYVTVEDNYIPYKERYPEDILKNIDWFGGDRVEYRRD